MLLVLASALFGTTLGLEWNHVFSSEQLEQEDTMGLFNAWRFEQLKVYPTIEEEIRRLDNFRTNMQRIAASNDLYYSGERSFSLRMNHFGDLTDDEFHAMYHNERAADIIAANKILDYDSPEDEVLAEGVVIDWKEQGKVTPVRQQGGCGSCWAFSATAAMECNYAIAHGTKPYWLSPQQLVDCDKGNGACSGGFEYTAWDYATAAGGLCKDADYPYTGREDSCKESTCIKSMAPKGEFFIDTSETGLANELQKGCVSVAIEADQFSIMFYFGGILKGICGTRLDHAVMATGYGVKNGAEYWIVKNSWGPDWGESGYMWICKNCGKNGNNGECGIAMDPHRPIM